MSEKLSKDFWKSFVASFKYAIMGTSVPTLSDSALEAVDANMATAVENVGGKKLTPLRFTNVGNEAATIAYKQEAYEPSALISPNFTVIRDGVKTPWDYSAITLQPGEYLEIVGKNTSAISNKSFGPPIACHFDIQGSSIEASGNIMSLLNPKAEIALPNNAFCGLFYGCSGLTAAPELPATTLATSCYNSMFNGCSGLTAAPELLATTLANSCYQDMFNGCSGLEDITVGFTAWDDGGGATDRWLDGVAAAGTFTCPAALDTTTRDSSHVPENWTVVNPS
jgi:hypothetical protein